MILAYLTDHELPRTFFEIGPLAVEFYGFFIMLGIIAALILGLQEGKQIGIKSNDIIDGLIIILPLAIIGTRLWFVLFQEPAHYFTNPAQIIRIWDGGLAIHGGILTAIIATYFFTKRRKMDVWKTLDLVAPGFLIAQAFGRWGNFFNQEAYGGVIGGLENGDAALSWAEQEAFLQETLRLPEFISNQMYIVNGDHGSNFYHPTFLYESLWNILGLVIVLILRRTRLIRSGDLIGFYLIWYSLGRFFIEFMRTDALYIGDTGIRIAQVMSVLLALAGVGVFLLNRYVLKRKPYKDVLNENS